MIRCKNYKKIIIYGNVSLVITFWAFILIAYITWKPISTFLCQFYPEDFANFAGSTIIFFINAALIIWWFDRIVALPWWVLLLLLPTLLALFFCHKFMCVLFIETFVLSWEIALGSLSKLLHNWIKNNYCKKDYQKGEVNVVKTTQIRLQNLNKNVAMTSFCKLVPEIWKK